MGLINVLLLKRGSFLEEGRLIEDLRFVDFLIDISSNFKYSNKCLVPENISTPPMKYHWQF